LDKGSVTSFFVSLEVVATKWDSWNKKKGKWILN
jgi:hypothetical protein